MSQVALLSVSGYELAEVKSAVERGFSFFGGVEEVLEGARRILLKPNLLVAEPPERAVTTHPVVFEAVAQVLKEQGFTVGFGDSPAFGTWEAVVKKAGFREVVARLGLEKADFARAHKVDFPQGKQHKSFEIARGIHDYQAMVSLPKWKTHGFMRVTGAVKNQFGCILGIRKGEFHFRLADAERFARMLVELNLLLRPRFFITDAIVAMEGDGPRNGRPRFMGLLAFARDPVALDATLCRVIGLDPYKVPTCKEGEVLGLGTWREEAITVVGDSWERFVCKDFAANRYGLVRQPPRFTPWVRRFLLPSIVIERERCVHCGVCVTMCPAHPKALLADKERSFPGYVGEHCIRCFCCQELCPHGAIEVRYPWIRRVLRK